MFSILFFLVLNSWLGQREKNVKNEYQHEFVIKNAKIQKIVKSGSTLSIHIKTDKRIKDLTYKSPVIQQIIPQIQTFLEKDPQIDVVILIDVWNENILHMSS
ncbi:MAG: hypothetical protein R3A45_08540 [Bdellovibrionota bacterium]